MKWHLFIFFERMNSCLHLLFVVIWREMDEGRISVVSHVVNSMHYAAAEGAAGDLHAAGIGPPVPIVVVELHFRGGADAVESSHDEEAVVHH